MSQRRYYDEEMRYLYEAGRAFAQLHPEQARYLNIDSVTDRDPYVERLFEGFAFLTGRIRQQLDDELPQYTEALCELLFPHFLRPVPSLTMLSFRSQVGKIKGARRLPRGTEVLSSPVGEEQVICRFRTTQEVVLQPLNLHGVELAWAPNGTSSVTLSLAIAPGVGIEDLDLRSLRLYFNAGPATAAAMHYAFTQRVREVKVESGLPGGFGVDLGGFGRDESVTLRGQQWVRPGGLAPEEALLPESDLAFSGLRLMQEMLCFRPKFWCVDLLGLDQFRPQATPSLLKITVQFDESFPEAQRFGKDQIRLYTSPAINLFKTDGEPIRVDHRGVEYRVVPDASHRKGVEVYTVESVVGIEDGTGRRHTYRSLLSPERADSSRTYTTSSRKGFSDGFDTTITLQGVAPEGGRLPVETLSIELRATNGSVPREYLRERSLTRTGGQGAGGAEVENITQPTLILYPPTAQHQNFYWKLLSHWSFNYRSAASPDALVGLMRLYDWAETGLNKQHLSGIRDVRWGPKERLHRGSILRGSEVTVELDEAMYTEIGDASLLGLILSRFFSSYATINSFVHLTVVLLPSGRRMTWEPERGEQPVL